MCVYIGVEILLFNLLRYSAEPDKGVDFAEIEKYCDDIKRALMESDINANSVYFGLNNDELEHVLHICPGVFKKSQDRYYKGECFDSSSYYFNLKKAPGIGLLIKKIASIRDEKNDLKHLPEMSKQPIITSKP